MIKGLILGALAVAASACATTPRGHGAVLHQPSPDTYRLPKKVVGGRLGTVALLQDEIVDTHTGRRLSRDALGELLRRHDVIFVGENHASRAHQAWQATVISILARDARPLAVGLEMLPRSVQTILDTRSESTSERDFIRRIHWYEHWGHGYRTYRPIFRVTGVHHVPLVALNAPDALPRAIARHGLKGLSKKLRALVPRMDLTSSAHREVFRALLGRGHRVSKAGAKARAKASSHPASHPASRPASHPTGHPHGHHGLRGDRLKRYYMAQVLWDATMADAVLRWRQGAPKTRVVVLAGAGHVMYDLGISRQLRQRAPELRQIIVLPVRVPPGKSRRVSRQVADVVIGIAPPKASDRPPKLGVELQEVKASKEAVIIKALSSGETPARRAGLRPGDRLRSIGGQKVTTIFDVRWALLDARRGQGLQVGILRGSNSFDVVVHF